MQLKKPHYLWDDPIYWINERRRVSVQMRAHILEGMVSAICEHCAENQRVIVRFLIFENIYFERNAST